jgi:hypothetical protein
MIGVGEGGETKVIPLHPIEKSAIAKIARNVFCKSLLWMIEIP